MPEESDVIEAELNQQRRRVDVDSNNFPARELVRMMLEGELNIAPTYQRKFRWPASVESSLIESVFLGLPVPAIFVATNEGFEWEVVDGLQRLSTLLHFLSRDSDHEALERIGRDAPLELIGLERVPSLNGKRFTDLPPPLQIYLGRQPLQITALTDKSDMQVRYDLFERLNRGAIELSPQEVRACVYMGDLNDFIDDLAEIERYQSLLKLQELKQNDGTAAETVLKFFAYMHDRENFTGKVRIFLNNYMKKNQSGFDFDSNRRLFVGAVDALHQITGGQPYLRQDYNVTPLVQFEASLIALGELIRDDEEIGNPNPNWVNDQELKEASMGGTNTKAALNRRIDRAKVLLRA